MRISIDPNGSSRIWPGHISAYRPAGSVLAVGKTVTVVQDDPDEPDFVGTARVIGLKGRFVGLEVDWSSFREEGAGESERGHEAPTSAWVLWELLQAHDDRPVSHHVRPHGVGLKTRLAVSVGGSAALTAAAAAGAILMLPQAAISGSVRPVPERVLGYQHVPSIQDPVVVS